MLHLPAWAGCTGPCYSGTMVRLTRSFIWGVDFSHRLNIPQAAFCYTLYACFEMKIRTILQGWIFLKKFKTFARFLVRELSSMESSPGKRNLCLGKIFSCERYTGQRKSLPQIVLLGREIFAWKKVSWAENSLSV